MTHAIDVQEVNRMKLIIDRFEGAFAICEMQDKNMINIERAKLPSEAKEGDMIIKTSEGYKIDTDATNKKRQHINKRMDDLWT